MECSWVGYEVRVNVSRQLAARRLNLCLPARFSGKAQYCIMLAISDSWSAR